jgi:hypothetical protein
LITFSILHLNHNLFGLLIDKAKLTSGFFSQLNQAKNRLENFGAIIRLHLETAKFNPESEKGVILKTIFSDLIWKEKIDIIKKYYNEIPIQLVENEIWNNKKAHQIGGDSKINKYLNTIIQEFCNIKENLFPPINQEVEIKNIHEVNGLFEEIRTIRNWILYFKMTLQIPLLIKMSGSFNYAIWDNFVDVVGREDGLFLLGSRDFSPLDKKYMNEFGFKVETHKKSFKEQLSKFNKVVSRIRITSERFKQKLAFRDAWIPAVNYLQRLEQKSSNNYVYNTKGYAPLDQNVIKDHLLKIFISSPSQFFSVEMAEVLVEDFNRIVRFSEIYGMEFFIKSYVFYATVGELIKKNSIQHEQLEYEVKIKSDFFSVFNFNNGKLKLVKEIIPDHHYIGIFSLFRNSILEIIESLKNQVNILDQFISESAVSEIRTINRNAKKLLNSFGIKIKIGDPFYNICSQRNKLLSKINWIESRLNGIESRSNSNVGSNKTIALNEIYQLQKKLANHYNLDKIQQNLIEIVFISERERNDIVTLKMSLSKLSNELIEVWENYIRDNNNLDIQNWIDKTDEIIDTISTFAPSIFNNEKRFEFIDFDHDLVDERELSPIQKILRARSYFVEYLKGNDLNGINYVDKEEYRISRVKRRLLSVVANINGLAEQAEKKQIERIIEITKQFDIYFGDKSPELLTKYKKTNTLLFDNNQNTQELLKFADFNLNVLMDENQELLPIFQEFDKKGIAPHLFKTGGIYDHNGISRKSGLIKERGQWTSKPKFMSKLLGDKHFKNLIDNGFINFIAHIAPIQEKDTWIGAVFQERYTYFEKIMCFMDSPEFQRLYEYANEMPKSKNCQNQSALKPVSNKIQKFLNELFRYKSQKTTNFIKDQPQAKI